MPVVVLRYEKYGKAQWFRRDLFKALPGIIGPVLEVEEKDVIVASAEQSAEYDYTQNSRDFEIYIVLHAFPDRMRNLQERGEQIQKGIREFLQKHREPNGKGADGFVWILPVETVFLKI